MKLPYYINEVLRAYIMMSSEDRSALMDQAHFDDDPQSCPVEYLPYLAAEVGVDIEGFDASVQRDLTLSAIKSVQRAGTTEALETVLSTLGNVQIKQEGNFSFVLDLSMRNHAITPRLQNSAENIVSNAKNARSVLKEIRLGYLSRNVINLSTGGVGEVCVNTEMLEGYRATLRDTVVLHTGAVAETSYRAIMGGAL